MRIMVTGSRDWNNWPVLCTALADAARDVPYETVILVHGGAKGADEMCETYAQSMDWGIETYRANWHAHGLAAGGIRNQRMVDTKPDVCVAFVRPCTKAGCKLPRPHGSHGTADCITRARAADITVKEYCQ